MVPGLGLRGRRVGGDPAKLQQRKNLATLQSQFPKDGGAVIRSPNTVMRQRLIRTVRKMVNQDSGKDVSAWAPGRPPIEAESAGQQTAGCHPRRQKKAPQWQTRRQGAHVGGGGGGKRGRRGPCREPRSNPALVGIGSVLVKSGRACPSAPSHQPVPSAHPMERAGRGGGRAKTVGAPGGPRAGNGPGLYFGERRGRSPTNPQSWFPRAGWVGPLALPCATGPHPPEKWGFSH